MGKMTLTVLAGVFLITLAAVPASVEGIETAVQSVGDSTSPPVVLALAAGHRVIIIHTSSERATSSPTTAVRSRRSATP
jgi:hypothetical protein